MTLFFVQRKDTFEKVFLLHAHVYITCILVNLSLVFNTDVQYIAVEKTIYMHLPIYQVGA